MRHDAQALAKRWDMVAGLFCICQHREWRARALQAVPSSAAEADRESFGAKPSTVLACEMLDVQLQCSGEEQ